MIGPAPLAVLNPNYPAVAAVTDGVTFGPDSRYEGTGEGTVEYVLGSITGTVSAPTITGSVE